MCLSKLEVLALHSPQGNHVGFDLEDTNIRMGMCYQVGTVFFQIGRLIHNAQASSPAADVSMAVAVGVPPRVPCLDALL